MGKTLSLDLRERVLAFIVEGHSWGQGQSKSGGCAGRGERCPA